MSGGGPARVVPALTSPPLADEAIPFPSLPVQPPPPTTPRRPSLPPRPTTPVPVPLPDDPFGDPAIRLNKSLSLLNSLHASKYLDLLFLLFLHWLTDGQLRSE